MSQPCKQLSGRAAARINSRYATCATGASRRLHTHQHCHLFAPPPQFIAGRPQPPGKGTQPHQGKGGGGRKKRQDNFMCLCADIWMTVGLLLRGILMLAFFKEHTFTYLLPERNGKITFYRSLLPEHFLNASNLEWFNKQKNSKDPIGISVKFFSGRIQDLAAHKPVLIADFANRYLIILTKCLFFFCYICFYSAWLEEVFCKEEQRKKSYYFASTLNCCARHS
jgi:hypothetical protein